jgi:hypothetical protein
MKTYPGTRPSGLKGLNDPRSTGGQPTRPRPDRSRRPARDQDLTMAETKGGALADRLKTAAEAKQALLAKFKPKPAVVDPLFAERGVAEAAELKAVRAERQAARAVKKGAAEAIAADAAVQADQRAERKRAKAPTPAEAKDKRDAKYAARKSRR